MITADQIVAHLVGDYILQSDYLANEKTKQDWAAWVHAWTYTLPFLFITSSLTAILVIMATHYLIDRYRLARYVCWLKNFLAPRSTHVGEEAGSIRWWHPWSECRGTGYHEGRPPWMAVWLMILCDNTMHILINGLSIHYLGGG